MIQRGWNHQPDNIWMMWEKPCVFNHPFGIGKHTTYKNGLLLGMVYDCFTHVGMDQYLLIPFLGEWTSIYQLFWGSPGVQGFDTLPCGIHVEACELWSCYVDFLLANGAPLSQLRDVQAASMSMLCGGRTGWTLDVNLKESTLW